MYNKIAAILILGNLVLRVLIAISPETATMALGFNSEYTIYLIKAIPYVINLILILLILKNVSWAKYILLLICIYRIAFIQELLIRLPNPTSIDIMIAIQCLFLFTALILLFMTPTNKSVEAED